MSFNPTVPGYVGENRPAARFRFREVVPGFSARAIGISSFPFSLPRRRRCPEGRGELFRGLSNNIDNTPRRQRRFPFYIWISEGIGLRVVRSYGTRTAVSSKIKDSLSI